MDDVKHDDPSWWPTDYFASRARFKELCLTCGAGIDSYPIEAIGPGGEQLTVDVASLTSSSDDHLIVLTSGVHGVEGFLGARVQIEALHLFAKNGIPAGTSIVMIHAANPWGFAHLRRVDENNIDINRNFFEKTPSSHIRYADLDPIINPKNTPSVIGDIKYWLNAAKMMGLNHGVSTLFKAIAQGQYDFPKGVFFGGSQRSESTKLLQKLILKYSASYKRVSILDIHSGLGPSATASLIGNSNMGADGIRKRWLNDHYGNTVYIDTDDTNAYNANGTFSRWCQTALREKQFLYLCVEIGTVNPMKLFSALRRENQAHHWASGNKNTYVKTKQALLDVFAPRSPHWKHDSVAQGIQVLIKTSKLATEHVNTCEQY